MAAEKRSGRASEGWADGELAQIRRRLEEDVARLHQELEVASDGLADQVRNTGPESGDEPADLGALSSDVEAETSLANNTRDILAQSERALARLNGSGYGVCESCDTMISKARLHAVPRATLCVDCQQAGGRR